MEDLIGDVSLDDADEVPRDPVATARRARRQGRVVAFALTGLLGLGTWWYATRDDGPPWVPTDAECATWLDLEDDARADWIERSIEASWPLVEDLSMHELRSIMRLGFATCDD